MTSTTVLRPVHAWFFAWERIVPSIYRVVATAVAALVAALLLVAVGLHPLVAIAIALPACVGLAIVQDHDERVLLPPDPEFAAALRVVVSRAPLQLRVDHATGPPRARQHEPDTFALASDPQHDHPLAGTYIEVVRSRADGWMSLYVGTDATNGIEPVEERLRERGEHTLAERAQEARTPAADAEAIAEALRAAYW